MLGSLPAAWRTRGRGSFNQHLLAIVTHNLGRFVRSVVFFLFVPIILDVFLWGTFQYNNLKEVFKTKWMLQLGNFFNHPNEFCYWCYQHRVNASPNINHSDNLLDELRRWVMSHLALWALWAGTKIYRLLKSGNCFMRAHLRAINYVSMLKLRFMIKVWEKSNMVRQSL